MALDKQRILNELGSVMNQLKSADCGCMGKLFGNSGHATSPSPPTYGGCQRNCCHSHGYGCNYNGSCGEPYSGNTQNMYTPCMGRCNPPKLYADTYNYLTDNLMQPTIKEVYDDLKSLTPDNTIANNPMANQMGLTNGLAAQNNMGDMSNMGNMNSGNMGTMGNMNVSNNNNFNGNPTNAGAILTNEANPNQMGQVGGMGPQIVNMLGNMTSQNKSNPSMGQNNQLTGPMVIDAPQSPHGQIGVTPVSLPMGNNQDVYNAQGYSANQRMTQSNMQPLANTQNTGNTNPAAQQMAAGLGQHSKGIAKFNEMFPGVMKNLGGDLGFDPMAIAIQMNPANQQQAAINTMNKMLQNNKIDKVFDQSANPALLAGKNAQQDQVQNKVPPNQAQQLSPLQQTVNGTVQPNATSTNQMVHQNSAYYNNAVNDNANAYGNSTAQLNSQQVYNSSAPLPNQSDQQEYQPQNIIDPNTGSEMAPPTLSSAYEAPTDQQNIHFESPNIRRVIQEPILPVDTSKYIAPKHTKYFEFNTLGQPIEKFSVKMYRTPEPSLPQTLSPQPPSKPKTEASKYSKVKSTVSKTSLMGAKAVGRTPSQLQHIYNQYKGSQSFTQQNIPAQGVNAVTHSEGKLTAPQINQQQRQNPVERVGGDTLANNEMRDQRTDKIEQLMGQIGDVPAVAKPAGDGKPNEMTPVINRKSRNGLQDMVYTAYPSSAAWSFHGVNASSYSHGHGRNRYRR